MFRRFIPQFFLLLIACLTGTFLQAAPDNKLGVSGLNAGNISISLEGRGLYLTADQIDYDQGTSLTVVTPRVGWLDDMRQEQLDALKDFDLNDLSELASYMDKGVNRAPLILDISIRRADGNSTIITPLDVKKIESKNGNIQFTLNTKLDKFPEEVEKASILYRTWHHPTQESLELALGGPRPLKAVCCNCSGGCAFLWILLGWCTTCVSFQGGEYCCADCQLPPAPGETCP